MSCLVDTETPTRWKKLTTWWPNCSPETRCHSSERSPQGNGNWTWGLTVLKMMLSRPWMTRFKVTVRADCAVSVWNPLPLSINALTHWMSAEGDKQSPLPHPWMLASKIKQTFLSTNLASLLASEWQAARPHSLSVTCNVCTSTHRFWLFVIRW